ncbi:unnamed protein product [Pleuronectes platessa]|uniref:Uncharacterized protein n=1 Tax=Pleuronectes platessa TaxID=8262 RepID=A0A9N7ZCB3_PLEPL|nr:unnamed protein product [Pleuronectes platessa]
MNVILETGVPIQRPVRAQGQPDRARPALQGHPLFDLARDCARRKVTEQGNIIPAELDLCFGVGDARTRAARHATNFVHPRFDSEMHQLLSLAARPISGSSADSSSCNWTEVEEESAALAQRKHMPVSLAAQRTHRLEQLE